MGLQHHYFGIYLDSAERLDRSKKLHKDRHGCDRPKTNRYTILFIELAHSK